jgi:uncharacterized protein YeaO (DUF488 family)
MERCRVTRSPVTEPKRAVKIKVKRAYDAPDGSDGHRTLVDRVWPRGLSRDALRLDDWVKDTAPSTELRTWFDHDRTRWNAFKARYFRELNERPGAVEALLASVRGDTLTLVFGAKDEECNNAVALKDYLERHAGKQARVG